MIVAPLFLVLNMDQLSVDLLFIIIFLLVVCKRSYAECAFNCRTYASITSGRHPLGFYSATWIYNSARPNPCIKITASDASLRLLEIKVSIQGDEHFSVW